MRGRSLVNDDIPGTMLVPWAFWHFIEMNGSMLSSSFCAINAEV